ncbi:MAG TPA: DUF805 domain-containing protein [Caulobacteraceae bacterium]|jgi:uncharacterized membrane protein YhaH (DUF805 family)|nr:DUF805 domain-containing protein [Caulobacteraceae bacterium]
MITAVVSFRGRLNRRQYFLGNLAIGGVLAGLGAALIGFSELAPTARPTLAMGVDASLLVIVAPIAVWSALSLQARRLRDIGLEPLVVIPLWLATLGLAQSWPMIAASISLALFACLYAWPGRRGGLSAQFDDHRITTFAPAPALATIRPHASRRRRR